MTVRYTWKVKEFVAAVVPIFNEALQATVDEGADTAARMIKRRPHSASALKKLTPKFLKRQPGRRSKPGESPTRQQGLLGESIGASKAENLRAEIGTPLAYGFWLEFGTSRGLKERPWLRPALLSRKGRNKMQRRFVKVATCLFKEIAL